MESYNRLTIDLKVIQANLYAIASKLPENTRIMPMVKAHGYGTDEIILTQFLKEDCGISIVGVSHVEEGAALRKKGCDISIFVISAPPFEAERIAGYNLEVAVETIEQCLALNHAALARGQKIKVHVHLNTGMQRFGCNLEEAIELGEMIQLLPGLILEGVMTHFVAAESKEFDLFTAEQIIQFDQLISTFKIKGISPPSLHVANSPGTLRFDIVHCNMVRVGVAMFGIYSSEIEKDSMKLMPALKLESKIVGINNCQKGETVGYCRSYQVQRDQEKIAIIPFGYHDGMHLHYSGAGYVLIHGKPAPMVGRICMDFMMVDITNIPEAHLGDHVLIFGEDDFHKQLNVEKVASWGKTNVRELIACLGPRVERVFKK